MSKINVKVKFGYSEANYVNPKCVVIDIVRRGKDGFECSVKLPIGNVTSEEFMRGVNVLYLASQAFHHRIYNRLREKLKELKHG